MKCNIVQATSNSSLGALNPYLFLGLVSSFITTQAQPHCVTFAMLVLFGTYYLIRPFVLSFVPPSHE